MRSQIFELPNYIFESGESHNKYVVDEHPTAIGPSSLATWTFTLMRQNHIELRCLNLTTFYPNYLSCKTLELTNCTAECFPVRFHKVALREDFKLIRLTETPLQVFRLHRANVQHRISSTKLHSALINIILHTISREFLTADLRSNLKP